MSISRRKFLSLMGAVGLGSLTTPPSAKAGAGKVFKGYSDSYGILHDISRCVGCRSCEKACNKVNNLPKTTASYTDHSVFDELRRPDIHNYTVVNRYESNNQTIYRKKQCNHCLEPACASACFVSAIKKLPEGPVVYDPSVCVGCRYCMVACPYEIPSYQYDDAYSPEIVKCTMCSDRIIKGQLPGCVESCPTEALLFNKRSTLIDVARKRLHKYPDRYINHIYGEYEVGGSSWLYISGTDWSDIGMREDLGTMPAPSLTSGALHVVPMVVGLWPVFLTGMYGISKRREKIAEIEKQEAVSKALELADQEAEKKLSEALEKAKNEKESALAKAEKEKEKAVREAIAKPDLDASGEDA